MPAAPPALISSDSKSFDRRRKGDYLYYLIAGAFLALGSMRLSGIWDSKLFGGVSDLLIGVCLLASGYMLSWIVVRRNAGLMLLIALLARLLMVPMEPSADYFRHIWDAEIMQAGFNPYEVAPSSSELEILRNDVYRKLDTNGQVSSVSPIVLWGVRISMDMSIAGQKLILIAVEMLLCLFFTIRYGTRKAALYVWNPLVIYAIGGGVYLDLLFVFPLACGFLLWDIWIEQKGGASTINANGGINGRLGQIVCLSVFLIGLSVSINLFLFPILFWISWHVLRKAGVKAGLLVALVGCLPFFASHLWMSVSLGGEFRELVEANLSIDGQKGSLLPWALERLLEDWGVALWICLSLLACFSIYSSLNNDTLGRFGCVYIGGTLILMPEVQCWHFLWMAPFAIGNAHISFKFGSVGALAFLWTGGVEGDLSDAQRVIVWLPFFVGAVWYSIKYRPRSKGLYVRSH